ncbi:hypothetical protein N7508_004711 [Penicillium antarcticum]|uniref:uncharacterized protein n=1 Tax=Penicillium antarcticum TaxID=416450 RepID=UPI0023991F6E|nr:uncharacterized protein N7508_004711 [Penicillium antarcticum]KAJ5305696.1 hypothetical protein N7508_004711 [Penicillium antarcticum]
MQDRDRTWVCLNTTMTGLEIHFDGKQNAKVETVSRSGSLSPCLSTIPSGGRADCDPALMSYFEHIICSSSTLVDNAHCNPYRYLILPMALKSEGLYHAALAIAANTLKLSDTTYRLPALEHHHRALAHLRGLLTKNDWCESEIYEMLGLVLMLCWFDISDSSRPSWVTHLTGFQNLIRTRKECPGPSYHSQELTSFLNRYFAFHLVLARTAFRVTSTSQAPPILPNTILEASDIIDPYVGFSPALLLMIDQVAELAWTQDGPDEISRKEEGEHGAYCGLAVMASLLGGLLCSRRDEEDKVIVLQLFEELNAIRRFGNIAPAVEVIEMVWRQRDLAVQDERKRRRSNPEREKDPLQGSRFVWEHAMVMLGGWKLSLT